MLSDPGKGVGPRGRTLDQKRLHWKIARQGTNCEWIAGNNKTTRGGGGAERN